MARDGQVKRMGNSSAQMTSQWLQAPLDPGALRALVNLLPISVSIFLAGLHPVGKKVRSGIYRVQHGIRSNKRNASLPIRANPGKDVDHMTISGLIMMRAHDEPRLGRGLISRTKEDWFCVSPIGSHESILGVHS